MTTPTTDGLHPNLARIAAVYDGILDQLEHKQLTVPAARAKIAQLEARDDQGTIWSIDPDSGAFVRKTAFGDMEFDTPPSFGVRTEDAFDYSTNPLVTNPNHRLSHTEVTQMLTPPTSLAGATQRMGPQRPSMAPGGVLDRIVELPMAVKGAAAAGLVAILAIGFATLGGDDKDPSPAPGPSVTAPAKHPAKSTTKKVAPKPKSPAKATTKK